MSQPRNMLEVQPAGMVSLFANSSAPSGWLKCNGAAVSRSTYSDLFAAIGTTYGAGDGSTTFALPNLRGEFLRALDDGRGVDSGRTIGTAQTDALQNITGSFYSADRGLAANTSVSGAFGWSGAGLQPATAGNATGAVINFDASRIVRTATETRARNIALLACIKF